MNRPPERVAIVGASLAGVHTAVALRRHGYRGALTIVGMESHFPPYDRPPLSKELLAGTWEPERARVKLRDSLEAEVLLGEQAVALDDRSRNVQLASGRTLRYDGLVVATGCMPRCLPYGVDRTARVHYLRTFDDCQKVKSALAPARSVTIIGAGLVGCEVAATCRRLGLDVTLIDSVTAPMSNAVGYDVGCVIADIHRSHGVTLSLDATVKRIVDEGTQQGVHLSDDRVIYSDVIVVAIGAEPTTGWLANSGLRTSDGLELDSYCRAIGSPHVTGAGDVARWWNPLFRRSMRTEHWTNAVEQAEVVAQNLLTGTVGGIEYANVPYFWSDQYDRKIQLVGVPMSEIRVVEPYTPGGGMTAEYRSEDGILTGAICINRPMKIPQYRARIEEENLAQAA